MGLLSNRVERGSLKPGDHIYSWRNAYIYAHHGIYVGDDRVIHFTSQEVGTGSVLDVFAGSSAPKQVPCATCAPSEGGHGVLSSCLDCFLAGGTLYRYEYGVSPAFFVAKVRGGTCTCAPSDPDDDVVNRAKHLLDIGFGPYNVVTNNCEDFAIYCKTGLVLDHSTMGQSGQAQGASIIVDRLATVLTAPLRNAATNVCGKAATAIGKYGVSSGRMATVFGRASTAIGKFGVISGSMAYGGAAAVIVDFGVYSFRRYAADIGVRKDVVRVPVDELISYKEALTTEFVKVVEPTIPASWRLFWGRLQLLLENLELFLAPWLMVRLQLLLSILEFIISADMQLIFA